MQILNLILAWTSVLCLILCMLPLLKRTRAAQNHPVLKRLAGPHRLYAGLALALALAHGLLAGRASVAVTGKLTWMALLALALLVLPRAKLPAALWRRIHTGLALCLCALAALHVGHALM